ncbi:MAG TPA: hypothetical protein VMW17_15305 [Candidatus Binatia bacterium]|nr:hypothetical protein [Candidatus Binatia bacterium]
MAEPALDGKGRRVAGFFVFMLGAGLLLESTAAWSGAILMSAGAVLFAGGVLAQPRRQVPS